MSFTDMLKNVCEDIINDVNNLKYKCQSINGNFRLYLHKGVLCDKNVERIELSTTGWFLEAKPLIHRSQVTK